MFFELLSMAASITSGFCIQECIRPYAGIFLHITHMIPFGTYVMWFWACSWSHGCMVYNTTLSRSQDLYGKTPWGTVKFLIPLLLAGVCLGLHTAAL